MNGKWQRLGHVGLGCLHDPGFGFAICNIIYASKSNSVAVAGAFICALLIVALRAMRQMQPPVANEKIQRLLQDETLSLRLLAAVIMLCSLYTMGAITLGYIPAESVGFAALQAISGILFATGNFMLATSLGHTTPGTFSVAATLRQPETWMAAGMLCLGLMTGPTALIVFPFIAIGYYLAFSNILRGTPEHHRHPKLWYAAGTLGFAGLAADPWLVCANVINAIYLVVIEHRLTPGGLQMLRLPDVKARA